jgi:hypothetical protein
MCPQTIFIHSSILRHKPTNLLHMVLRPKPRNNRGDFEDQTTKLLTLVLRPKLRNCRSGFEAKQLRNHHHRF